MKDFFIVDIGYGRWDHPWPDYFMNFYQHCKAIADGNDWQVPTVMNTQLKPHGRFIMTKTQGWYLRWENAQHHTAFVLRWS